MPRFVGLFWMERKILWLTSGIWIGSGPWRQSLHQENVCCGVEGVLGNGDGWRGRMCFQGREGMR